MKNNLKGIILAGGHGSRLFPLTYGTSKQLLPVYDKPMIYYPLSVLMGVGIKDILIISTPKDTPRFKDLFGSGKKLGIQIDYIVQKEPRGIAESFILAANFIKNDNVCLILGDNIFFGQNFNKIIEIAIKNLKQNFSTIFGVSVKNPNDFGVISYDANKKLKKIIEKPLKFVSNVIVSGLYFYTNDVIAFSKNLKLSERNEYEITDINNRYIERNKLKLIELPKEIFWTDTGTYEALMHASNFFYKIEKDSGKKIAIIEEIALKKGYIQIKNLLNISNSMKNSQYGKYLLELTNEYRKNEN